MAALTPVVDSLDKVDATLRTFYEQKDGKFHLILDAAPPGFVATADHASQVAKVVEFRDKNVALLKEVEELRPLKTKYAGIDDPEAAKTAISELAALKAKGVSKPDDLTSQIKAAVDAANKPLVDEITNLRTSNADERKRADAATLRATIGEKFGKIGGVPDALDFILGKAAPVFKVENGIVVAQPNQFSSVKPGDPLPVDEWLRTQTKESAFAFKPSGGSGAETVPGGGGGGLKPGQTELRDPTPQQLGEHAADIKSGKVKVTSSSAV